MELFFSAIMGIVVMALVQIGKRTGISTSTAIVYVALFCGAIWTALEMYAPVGLTDNVLDFAGKMVGLGAIVYSALKVAVDKVNKI